MYDVMFVDDDKALADSWRDLIVRLLALRVVSTVSAAEAFEIAKNDGVKIAVLDQRMPEEMGTSLGARLHELDTSMFLVLISGEASYTEAGDALRAGFVETMHKNEALGRLPGVIMNLVLRYEDNVQAAIARSEIVAFKRPGLFRRKYPVVYRILSVDNIEDNFTFADGWKTRARIDAGVSQKEELHISWSQSIEVELERSFKSAAEFGLSSGGSKRLSASLKSEIAQRVKDKVALNTSEEVKVERTLSLPEEPSDPFQLHVKARSFQVAPVYVRVVAKVASTCKCCGETALRRIIATLPVRKYATRHVDHFSDGQIRETVTGFEDL